MRSCAAVYAHRRANRPPSYPITSCLNFPLGQPAQYFLLLASSLPADTRVLTDTVVYDKHEENAHLNGKYLTVVAQGFPDGADADPHYYLLIQ